MWIKEAFDHLGIAPTDEQRQVKKAYARLVKSCHPEEDPEGWKTLHEAYETALAYARQRTVLKQAGDGQRAERRGELSPGRETNTRSEAGQGAAENGTDAEPVPAENDTGAEPVLAEDDTDGEPESAENGTDTESASAEKDSDAEPVPAPAGDEEDDTEKIFTAFDLIERQKREKEAAEEKNPPTFDPLDSRYSQPPKKKRYGSSLLFCAVIVIVFGLYAISRVGKPGSMSAGNAAGEMADYLNSKYETQQYSRGEFAVKKITLREMADNSDVLCGYYSVLPGEFDTYVYLLIRETKNNEKVMVLYDNCQEEEITADLQKEICERTGIKTGMLRLSTGGNDYYERRFIESHPAYTTRYDGDLEAFFRAEAVVRSNCMDEDIHKAAGESQLRLNFNPDANPNGRCNFYYPDEGTAELSDRMSMESWSMPEKVSQALSDIEDRYDLQVMAAALPQSCYQALQEKGSDLKKLSTISNASIESPLTAPLVAGWYMNDTNDYASTSGLMDSSEMMDILNRVEEGALDQTPGEIQESSTGEAAEKEKKADGEESQNLHFIAAQKLSEGIYILPEYETTKAATAGSYKLSQTVDENTLAISCTGKEAESCVLVLDRKALHIPDQVASVTRRNTSDPTDEDKTLQIVPYTDNDVLEMMQAAADGEGFIFLNYEVGDSAEDADTYFIEIQ